MPQPFSAACWPAKEEVLREASLLAAGPGGSLRAGPLPPAHTAHAWGSRAALRQRISHFSLGALAGWGKENEAYLQGGRQWPSGRLGFEDSLTRWVCRHMPRHTQMPLLRKL